MVMFTISKETKESLTMIAFFLSVSFVFAFVLTAHLWSDEAWHILAMTAAMTGAALILRTLFHPYAEDNFDEE